MICQISGKWSYIIHLVGISSHLWSRYSFQFIIIWSVYLFDVLKLETTKRNLLENNKQNWNLKSLIWLAIVWCTLIRYLLNMHFNSCLHANIEEIIITYKNLYVIKNFARSVCTYYLLIFLCLQWWIFKLIAVFHYLLQYFREYFAYFRY